MSVPTYQKVFDTKEACQSEIDALRANLTPAQPDNIPQELRDLPQWITWRYEVGPQKNGTYRVNKTPYRAEHNRRAKTDTPATWTDFATAIQAAERTNRDGIGFVFSKNDPYSGVDFDACRDPETGEILDPQLSDMLDNWHGYKEISISKTGTHQICKGTLPDGKGIKITKYPQPGMEIEVYDRGRYFIFTGKRLNTIKEIPDMQDALDALVRLREQVQNERKQEKHKEQKNTTKARAKDTDTLEDSLILQKLQNETKWQAIYNGNWQGDYDSQSEADAALCYKLAFWTDKDAAQMDRLFRQSGLMRDKWEREDYRKKTIQSAIDNVQETWRNAKYYKKQEPPQRDAPDADVDPYDAWLDQKMDEKPVIKTHYDQGDRKQDGDLINETFDALCQANNLPTLFQNGLDWTHIPEGLQQIRAIHSTEDFESILTLHARKGYVPEHKLYILRDFDVQLIDSLDKAREILFYPFQDFIFETEADRATAFAFLFSLLLREHYSLSPLYLFTSAKPGTGKDLLTGSLYYIAHGETLGLTGIPQESRTNVEIQRMIVAQLQAGKPVAGVGNLPDASSLNSPDLERLATSRVYEGKVLYQTAQSIFQNTPLWIFTGNNIQLASGLPRRFQICRLVTNVEDPSLRRDFQIKDRLEDYIEENRDALLNAALTLIIAWIKAGSPESEQRIGSFETWAAKIGGLLEFIGLSPDFTRREISDYDYTHRAFVIMLYEHYQGETFTVHNILNNELNLDGIVDTDTKRPAQSLARFFNKVAGQVFTTEDRKSIRLAKEKNGREIKYYFEGYEETKDPYPDDERRAIMEGTEQSPPF